MKRNIMTLICMAIFAIANVALAVSSPQLPVVKILGADYYMYESKKGDSLFGIARQFGWNDEKLQKLNPSAVSPLKKGVKIYYPVDSSAQLSAESAQIENVTSQPATHHVKKGETVYGISHQYGIAVEQLYRLNPSSRNGIKAGETLLLSDESAGKTSIPDAKPRTSGYYKIKPGDTMYGVAKANDITVAALMTANPGISESNFRSGETIKLPAPGSGVKTVKTTKEEDRIKTFEVRDVNKNETWSSIANSENVDVNLLKETNPGVDKPKDKQTVIIPKVEKVMIEKVETYQDPRELSESGLKEIYEDVHKVAKQDERNIRIAIVTESPSSKKDLEFVRGFLTGINEMKSNHYKVSLKVIDGAEKSEDVIISLDDFKPDMLFVTYDKVIPDYISEYAEVSQTPVVNTFDVKSELYKTNPYFVQLLAPSQDFNDNIADNVYSKYHDYKLIFVGEEDSSDQLAASLKSAWPASSIKYMPTSSFDTMTFNEDGKYLFYGYSVKKAEVQKLLKDVGNLKEEKPLTDIKVLGRPNWIVFDSSLSSELHKADVMIPSRFYLDENAEEAKIFSREYKELFNRNPVKSLPLYAAVGYDSAKYFIKSMINSSNDINELLPSSGTIQSDFDLKRVSNWGGFINPAVFLVRFTPYDTIDKIVIK